MRLDIIFLKEKVLSKSLVVKHIHVADQFLYVMKITNIYFTKSMLSNNFPIPIFSLDLTILNNINSSERKSQSPVNSLSYVWFVMQFPFELQCHCKQKMNTKNNKKKNTKLTSKTVEERQELAKYNRLEHLWQKNHCIYLNYVHHRLHERVSSWIREWFFLKCVWYSIEIVRLQIIGGGK